MDINDYDAESLAHLDGQPAIGQPISDSGFVNPAHIQASPGQRFDLKALIVDERHLGHLVSGVDDTGRRYRGQLRAVTRHEIDGRILITVDDARHSVEYMTPVTVTVIRNMPTDPRLRTGRPTVIAVDELTEPAGTELAA